MRALKPRLIHYAKSKVSPAQARKLRQSCAVTADRFKEARFQCGLSVPEAGKLFRVTPRTVQNWEAGRAMVPYTAYKLMRILRGWELPGHHWEGFRIQGDTLWTPEGHAFKPEYHRWWSLTCRMAAEFRNIMAKRRAVESERLGGGEEAQRNPAATAEPSLGLSLSPTRENHFSLPPVFMRVVGVASGATMGPEWGHIYGASYVGYHVGQVQSAAACRSETGSGSSRVESATVVESTAGAAAGKGVPLARSGQAKAFGVCAFSFLLCSCGSSLETCNSRLQGRPECSMPMWKWAKNEALPPGPVLIALPWSVSMPSDMLGLGLVPSGTGLPAGLYKAMADMPTRGESSAGVLSASSIGGAA